MSGRERNCRVLWSALIGVKGHPKLVGLWLSPLRSWPTTFGLFALDPERTSAPAPPVGSGRGTGGPHPTRSRMIKRKATTMYAGDQTTSWNDAGPCPQCGDSDCWLGCPPVTESASYDEAEAAGVDATLRFVGNEQVTS